MQIFIEKEVLSRLQQDLKERNKKNDIANNFIRISLLPNEKFKVELLVDNVVYLEGLNLTKNMFFSNVLRTNLFDHRDSYIALVEDNCIQVQTSGELHCHTGYSLLDGMSLIADLVKKASYGSAITDHGVMYGCIDFYKQMKANHKKPIIGFEAYTESYMIGEEYKVNKAGYKNLKNNHLVLLAKNEEGYKNLSIINSLAQKSKAENGTSRPRVKYEWLEKYNEGIICLTACLGGEIPQNIISGNLERARLVLEKLLSIFGKENLYLEIQRHKIEDEELVTAQMKEFAKEYDLKLVATTDSHYLNKEDKEPHEMLLCLQRGKKMSDTDRWVFPGEGYFYHTCEEKEELFSDIPEAIFNTLEVIEKCNFDYTFGNYQLPKFPIPEGKTEKEYFIELCWKGFEERFPIGSTMYSNPEYRERLTFEIETICKMGYPAYFLIVWDFIKFAKDNNIAVGPGRGSACGSLASYCLGITDMNPIPYDLLFERFLNPDRISMPDIDVDFNDALREVVINYCRNKYGADAVSKIITFGTMAAKNSVLDTARVWGKSVEFGRNIADKIPSTPKITLAKALKESAELKHLYDTDEESRDIIDKAMKIEGLPRNISQHACGVIIAPSAVTNYCPQVYVKNKDTGLFEGTIQCIMSEVEELGLLKMDFLGLKTMTVLQECVEDINRMYGKNLTIDTIPINDPKVFDFISKGLTKGVFQLEGAGMTSFMKDLFQDVHSKLIQIKKSDKEALEKFGEELFERVIAGISLYRPGPIGEIPNYIKGMLDSHNITYDTPELENVLNTTYGVIVYQEQAMMAVRQLAGFSKGQADTVRKAMGKKKQKLLNEYGEYFVYGSKKVDKFKPEDKKLNIKGCIELGIPEDVAIKIWNKMKAFGEYAFNKSHAGGYAVIAIRTAWLSYYYPAIFIKANLNAYITKPNKVKLYLADAHKRRIKLLPPSVNESNKDFTVIDESTIRFGLRGIKFVGSTSSLIIEERNNNGAFKSYQDLVERLTLNAKLDSRSVEGLIYSGAMDEFEGTRKAKIKMIDEMLKSARKTKSITAKGQITLFDIAESIGYTDFANIKEIKMPDCKEFDKKILLEKEREANGYYITEHPLDSFSSILKDEKIMPLYELVGSGDDEEVEYDEDGNSIEVIKPSYDNKNVKIAGVIREVQNLYTKKGKLYKKFILEDTTGEISCLMFNLEKNSELIMDGERIILQGKFQSNEFGTSVIVNKVSDLSIRNGLSTEITVIGSSDIVTARKQWRALKDVAKIYAGNTKIKFLQGEKEYEFPDSIKLNNTVLNKLQNIFGENNCELAS